MLVIELNEFNPELLDRVSSAFQLPNLRRLLELRHTHTQADCDEERHGLDPWVQWVSFHTGACSAEHGIRHLGDVSHLRLPQFWEEYSSCTGKHVGLWGVMNAKAGAHPEKIEFFFPDPWTFSEQAMPAELDRFLRLPRYYAKNYLKLKPARVIATTLDLVRYTVGSPARLVTLARHSGACLRAVLHGGIDTTILFGIFDLVNAALFDHYKRRSHCGLSVIFLNSIAHLQHHAWTSRTEFDRHVEAVMRLLDRTLGILFDASSEEELVVLNAFRQEQSLDEGAFLYRQIDPSEFLREAGILPSRIEQLMTNDAHLYFASEEECREAAYKLEGARVDGQRIFDVELSRENPRQLFYQIDFWNAIPPNALLHVGASQLDFYAWFVRVVQRSGKHVLLGDVFARGVDFPPEAPLHAITGYLREHLWGR